jgi:hypothetical protein
MSSLFLFILFSLVGAAAFFFAGLLLLPRRSLAGSATSPPGLSLNTNPNDHPTVDLKKSGALVALCESGSADEKGEGTSEPPAEWEETRKRDAEKLSATERERDLLRMELEEIRKREGEKLVVLERERDRLRIELEQAYKSENDKPGASAHEPGSGDSESSHKLASVERERDRLRTELELLRKHEPDKSGPGEHDPARGDAEQKREVEKLKSCERERDWLRSELERTREQGRKSQERVRVLETESRTAREREEKAAAAQQQRLTTAMNERQEQEATWRKQKEELSTQLAQQKTENQRLQQQFQGLQTRENTERQELDRLRASQQTAAQEKQRGQESANAQEKLALTQEKTRLQTALQAAEKREAEALARLAQVETEGRSKAGAAEENLRTQQSHLQAEVEKLTREIERRQSEATQLREQNQKLSETASLNDDELVKTRAQANKLSESLRAAEARLAEGEHQAQDKRAHAAQPQPDHSGELKEAKAQLAVAQEENRKLRGQVEEQRAHKGGGDEVDRLNAEQKRLRLDAEMMARRLQELQQGQNEIASLRSQAAEAEALNEEVNYLRRREQELEARLYASGFRVTHDPPPAAKPSGTSAPSGTLESNLNALVKSPGPRTAVLADTQGFLIARAGESVVEEGLAAFAAVVAEMVTRARSMLPLADVESVRLTDANKTILTCRLFETEDMVLGVATLGSDEPPAEGAKKAVVGLSAILATQK